MLDIRRALATAQQVIEDVEDSVFSILVIGEAKGMLSRLKMMNSKGRTHRLTLPVLRLPVLRLPVRLLRIVQAAQALATRIAFYIRHSWR